MAKISVYLNGNASQSTGHFSADEFKKFFFRHEVNIHSPDDMDALRESLERDVHIGTDYVFAVGGDGTAHTISQYLINKNVKFLVVPAGTANDFASEMASTNNIKKISHIFNAQTTQKVDAIKVNDRYMLTNGGLGMACEVAKNVNRYRHEKIGFKKFMKVLGKNTYSLIYAQQMLAKPFITRDILIESPDSPLLDPRVSTALILINNQEFVGGKFRVAPGTKNNDGKFNVSIFTHKNRMELLKCTLQMLSGSYPTHDQNLISFETNKITLNSMDGKDLEFFGDGETFSPSPILNIEIQPSALEVCSFKGDSLLCSSYTLDQIEMIQ